MRACLLLVFTATCAALADPGLIRLKNATINPKAPVLQSVEKFLCSPTDSGKRNYIVQPKENFSQSELEGLSKYGMEVIGHIPPNAYIIQADPKGLEEFKTETNPLYVGEYRPEYKIGENLLKDDRPTLASAENYRPLWLKLADANEYASVKRDLEGLMARHVVLVSKSPALLQADLPKAAIMEAAALSPVLSIEKRSEDRVCNYFSHLEENQNSAALNTLGYSGEGEKIMVCDTGLDSGDVNTIHPDLKDMSIDWAVGYLAHLPESEGGFGRALDDWYDYDGHGTHVSGIALGRGTIDYKPYGEAYDSHRFPGAAPKASLGFLAIGNPAGGKAMRRENGDDLDPFYSKGYRICNNSWGHEAEGEYDSYCVLYDGYMWNHPEFLMLFSAGNRNTKIDVEDNCTMESPASSKNVLTVGNAEVWNEESTATYYSKHGEPYGGDLMTWPCDNENQGMTRSSSHGPCEDGRIKPDLVAPGSWITSLLNCENDPDRSKLYIQKGGTSMSTPNVSGCAAIVREYLRKNFEISTPSAALVKAVLINGCRSMGTGQYGNKTNPDTGLPYVEIPDTTPNCVSGYGHVNLKESLIPASGSLELLEGNLAESGNEAAYVFSKAIAGPVKITLCWTDYPGTEAAAQALVNDLDLEISDGTATYYAGGATSKSDSINNVEQYACASFPACDEITVTVRGYNIMQGPQPFAMAISGLVQVPEPAFLGFLGLLALAFARKP